ncbi:MAG TPA: hypothetical protein DEO82_00365 [Eubacterium sp.]|nr:hypothetical protein [Eubacterium sp.]
MKKKDIPLDREKILVSFLSGVFIQLFICILVILLDLMHGKGFEALYMMGQLFPYLYRHGIRDFVQLVEIICIFSPFIIGVFLALRGIYYQFKRRIILKYGKRYDATIIAIKQMCERKDHTLRITVRYRMENGEFKFYKNPGLNPFTDYRIVSKACSIYVLGRSKYVTDFVLAPMDLVEEFKKLTEELGSEELAMEELKRRYGDTGDNSRIGGY